MDSEPPGGEQRLSDKILQSIVGKPLDINKPSIFHRPSLIPLLAWIGLGADGLSSSSYGPEEAFRAIGTHPYLAVFLGMATACFRFDLPEMTVVIA